MFLFSVLYFQIALIVRNLTCLFNSQPTSNPINDIGDRQLFKHQFSVKRPGLFNMFRMRKSRLCTAKRILCKVICHVVHSLYQRIFSAV